jgi:hypothetical protein
MDQIEFLLGLVSFNIGKPKHNIGHWQSARLMTRHFELNVVDICTDHSSFGPDESRQIEDKIPAAATNIQARHSGPETNPLQKSKCCRLEYTRQDS